MAADDPAPSSSHGALSLPAGHSQLEFDIDFYEHVVANQGGTPDLLRYLAELLSRKGLHQRSLLLWRRLAAMRATDYRPRYQMAANLVQVGALDEAIAALREAFGLGFRDADSLAQDLQFETIFNEPAFRALIHEHHGLP